MPAMVPRYYQGSILRIETSAGVEVLALGDIGDQGDDPNSYVEYLEGKEILDTPVERVEGWLCELHMPGCMDRTGWSGPFDTERDARAHILDTFDVDPDSGETLEAPIEDKAGLNELADLLWGKEWDSETMDAVARIVRATGRDVKGV